MRFSFTALAVLALAAPAVAAPQAGHPSMAMPNTIARQGNSKLARADFNAAMRKLWEDHIFWTRQFIVSASAGLPDADKAAARLMRNQADIGDAIKPFYGNAAGDQLTALLKGHIAIAAELVGAAKANNQSTVQSASTRWTANADSIATFLAGANPNWKAADLTSMMHQHLDLTLQEASARLKGDWDADIAAFDKVHEHILGMADALSSGIEKQFPAKFR